MRPTEGKCSLHLDALVGTYSPQAAEICLLAWLGAFMKASVRAGQRRNKTVGSVVVGFVYAILVFIMLNGTFDVSVVNFITHMFTKYCFSPNGGTCCLLPQDIWISMRMLLISHTLS